MNLPFSLSHLSCPPEIEGDFSIIFSLIIYRYVCGYSRFCEPVGIQKHKNVAKNVGLIAIEEEHLSTEWRADSLGNQEADLEFVVHVVNITVIMNHTSMTIRKR